MTRGELGLSKDPTVSVDLYAAADSAFSAIERASPKCAAVTKQWRQQKPWLNMLNASIAALNAGQLDSAEIFAKRSLVLDRSAPYAYSVLGSIAQTADGGPEHRSRDAGCSLPRRDRVLAADAHRRGNRHDLRGCPLQDPVRACERRFHESGAGDGSRQARGSAGSDQAVDGLHGNRDRRPSGCQRGRSCRGDVHRRRRQRVRYRKSTPQCLRRRPNTARDTWSTPAWSPRTTGGYADAAALFNAALAQNPYSRDAINNLAASYIQTNEFGKAMPLIDRLVALDPSNPDNPLLYAFAYQGLYKGTKDKNLQKTYTDSLIYFNNLSENAPVKVAVTEFSRRPERDDFQRNIKNLSKTSKTYTLAVEFLDKSGNVVAHRDHERRTGRGECYAEFQDYFCKGRRVRVQVQAGQVIQCGRVVKRPVSNLTPAFSLGID